jgi:hypothetical protein
MSAGEERDIPTLLREYADRKTGYIYEGEVAVLREAAAQVEQLTQERDDEIKRATKNGRLAQRYYDRAKQVEQRIGELQEQLIQVILDKDARIRELEEALRVLIGKAAQYIDTERGDLDGALEIARAALTESGGEQKPWYEPPVEVEPDVPPGELGGEQE